MTVRSGYTELAHETQHLGGCRLVVDAGDLAERREPRAQARLLAWSAHNHTCESYRGGPKTARWPKSLSADPY